MTNYSLNSWIRSEVLVQPAYRVHTPECRIKLNQNECPWDWSETLKLEVLNRLSRLFWNRYPELIPERLKTKIAISLDLTPEQIVIGNGSNEVLQALFTVILRTDDSICTLSPTFSVYHLLAEQRGARVIVSPLDRTFDVNPEDLIRKCQEARITVICNPNTPTGSLIPLDVISQVAKATPGIVVIDEAYGEFSGVTAIPLLNEHPNMIVTRTFSKAFALAGFRVGYAVMSAELAKEVQKGLLPFNLDSSSVVATEVILEHYDLVRERVRQILEERNRLIDELNTFDGVEAWPSHANFFLLQTHLGAGSTFRNLIDRGILVRDVSAYPGCENMVRITVGTPEENQSLLAAIRQIL